jgi:hypothetical protein
MSVPALANGSHHLPPLHGSYQNNMGMVVEPAVNANNKQGYYLPKGYLKTLPIMANGANGFTITSTRRVGGPHQAIKPIQHHMQLHNSQQLQQQQQQQQQEQQMIGNSKNHAAGADYWNKPRLITIIRATDRPRKKITILLNRKALHSYEQFVCDISDAFGLPQWKNDKVRKLYTLRGRKVQGISDFFRNEDIFIGVSGKEPLKASLLLDLLKEVNPDDEETAHGMLKEWESSRSRSRTKPRNGELNSSMNKSLVAEGHESEMLIGKSLDEEKYNKKKSKLSCLEFIKIIF